jgi:hypothetical protein
MSIRLPDFLEGAVDLHVHSSPDIDERKFDDISLARVLSTDLGQPSTPAWVEGMKLYAERLRASGFSVDHVRQMMVTNPARLLGLRAA